MASFSYFLQETFLQSDPTKIKEFPSTVVYNLPYFIVEFALILIFFIAIYLFPQLSSHFSWNFFIVLFIIWIILVKIMIILSLDLLNVIRLCIEGDLTRSLVYDFREKSAIYGEDSIYFEQRLAYTRYGWTNNDDPMCSICRNKYDEDDMNYDKSLLFCGHMFHKECLRKYEKHQWDNDIFLYGASECPLCREEYYIHSEKWDYNENYWGTIPWYLREYKTYGEDTIHSLYWDIIDEHYQEYKNQDVSERPGWRKGFTKCMKAIISNICNLGIEFLWKCIAFTKKWMEYLITDLFTFFEDWQS